MEQASPEDVTTPGSVLGIIVNFSVSGIFKRQKCDISVPGS